MSEKLFIVQVEVTKQAEVVVCAENEEQAKEIIDSEGVVDDITYWDDYDVYKHAYPMTAIPTGWDGACPYGNEKETVNALWEKMKEENLRKKQEEAMKPLFKVGEV